MNDPMNDYFFSFTLYAIPANFIVIMFYITGKDKVGLLKGEYFFIYVPWFGLVILSWLFFDDMQKITDELSLQAFLVILQSVGCGILGGMVLLPRFLFRNRIHADSSPLGKLRFTALSSVIMTGIYVITRIILFTGIRAVI
jgi:hypothetical protein